MGDVEDHGRAKLFHHRQAPHIHHQIVVAEARAAFRHKNALVTSAASLFDGVAHVPGRKELALLDVHDGAGAAHREQQIRLARKKGGNLENVANLGRRLHLIHASERQ